MGETVEDIVSDTRSRAEVAGRQDEDATVHHSVVAAMLRDIADRIEAAYKNLPGMWILPAENAKLREENAKLRAENAQLTEAMSSVVGCADSTCCEMGVCRMCPVVQYTGGV